ncbi:RNA polymerase sigma factor SigW [Paenibacillus herberti]|uniref:RNA polymerase sigma factor SigW n=1 Tax=Paenibacillus herberti TaxID=1619309 RepID=UPI003CCBF8EA
MKAVKSIEANLIRLALKGDQRAFAELVGMYQDKLYHLAYRMLYNRQEAEDAVQETFLRVFRNMERYDDSMKFSTWIYRITTNLSIDRLRRRKPGFSLDAELPEHDGLDGYSMFASEDTSPEEEVLLSETQHIIRNAIDTLPPKYKTVMVLRYLEDLSLQEIGDVMDMPVTTIKTRVHRGREFLRKKLEHKL